MADGELVDPNANTEKEVAVVDSGPGDKDLGVMDTGPGDEGVMDTGPGDKGVMDTGLGDEGVMDTGPAGDEGKVRLKRQLGLLHGVAFICGLVIGTGIWVSPTAIMQYTQSVGGSLLIWGIWGGLSMCIGLVYAELGATFPRSGGKYVYLEEAFGPFLAFLYMWAYLILMRPGANAIKLLTFSVYVLKPVYPDCDVPQDAIILLSFILGLLLMFVNIVNVKLAARWQSVFTGICILALSLVVIMGLVWIGKGHTENFKEPFSGGSSNPSDYMMAFAVCYYGYSGTDVINFVMEELKNPLKNLPRALCISMSLITFFYIMANIAFCAVLGVDGIIQSQAVAASFAVKTFGPAAWLMSVFIGINTAGSFNSGTLVGSRLCFVAARKGFFPQILNLINLRFLSPITSLIFLGILSVIYCLFDVRILLSNFTIIGILSDMLTMVALLWFRYKRPGLARPFKIPIIIPSVLVLILGVVVVIPLVTKTKASMIGIAITLCTGVPYYVLFVLWKPNMRSIQLYYDSFTRQVQKLLYCAKEDKPTF